MTKEQDAISDLKEIYDLMIEKNKNPKIMWDRVIGGRTLKHYHTIIEALRILDLIESDILEDSQCGETGEYGWFITPENRQKIEGLIDEQ